MAELVPIIERAFQLARSGKYATTTDVMRALKTEGYSTVDSALSGRLLRRQIQELCTLREQTDGRGGVVERGPEENKP